MTRLLAALFVSLPILAQADLRSDLQKKYNQLDDVIAKKDSRAVSSWIAANTTPDFTYTSRDKHRYDRAKFEKGLRDQLAVTQKINSLSTKVASVRATGAKVVANVSSDTSAIVVFDSRPMRLVDMSRTVDTWVRVGKDWRLQKSVQTKADIKIFQK